MLGIGYIHGIMFGEAFQGKDFIRIEIE